MVESIHIHIPELGSVSKEEGFVYLLSLDSLALNSLIQFPLLINSRVSLNNGDSV